MKKFLDNIEQWATWGGAAFCVIAAVIAMTVLRVGLPQPPPVLELPPIECAGSRLEIGARVFHFQVIERAEDGSFVIPPGAAADDAFWVAGDEQSPLFYLSPAAENRALLASLVEGEPVKITWGNCNTSSFSLLRVTLEMNDPLTIAAGLETGLAIAVQDESAAQAWVARSDFSGEDLIVIPTPDPEEILAEIGLLETGASADRATVGVRISIRNAGQTAFTLAAEDISLLVEGAAPAAPLFSEPALPVDLEPGQTQEIVFAFARPDAPAALLRVLTVEYLLEGY
ncbi:MAG: hypothetical protein ROW39_04935 [Anaerolineaceae bacterium]